MKTITYDETMWRLVPTKLTDAMGDAIFAELGSPSDWYGFNEAYEAMLAAAPQPEEKMWWREIAETSWAQTTDKAWFEYCQKSPEHDTWLERKVESQPELADCDECAANHQGHSFLGENEDGKPSCRWCGESQLEVAAPEPQIQLSVWYGTMPESNGKTNWTAILYNKVSEGIFGGIGDGLTIARSEYPDRVRYEADFVKHLIGEIKHRPSLMDYDSEKHSGYVEQSPRPQGAER